jgi:hypothetical protein
VPRITEGQFALGGLALFALWLFVALPLLYYPRDKSSQDYQRATGPNSVGNEAPLLIPLKLLTTSGREQIATYCASKLQDQKDDWTHRYICDVKITDAYLAVFNGLLVLVTGGLILVGFLTIKKMRDTEERQLRAYVFIESGRLERNFDDNRLAAKMKIKNSGQTPAYELTHTTAVRIVPPEFADGFSEEGFSKQKFNVPPNTELSITFFSKSNFDLEDQREYANGNVKILVYGTLKYRDAFRKTRTTDFRFEVSGDVWASRGSLSPTEDGNGAT